VLVTNAGCLSQATQIEFDHKITWRKLGLSSAIAQAQLEQLKQCGNSLYT
jgi:hypothetical protein